MIPSPQKYKCRSSRHKCGDSPRRLSNRAQLDAFLSPPTKFNVAKH